MRRFFIIFFFLVSFLIAPAKGEELPVRLHVIAESNDTEAQAVKMNVKDAVLSKATEITEGAKNAQAAYLMLFTSVSSLRMTARDAAAESGFTGDIEVECGIEKFPARLYGDLLLKEGEYPSLIVRIGKAEGKNWWCVIYPDLCLYGEKAEEGGIQFYSKIGYWFKKWWGR